MYLIFQDIANYQQLSRIQEDYVESLAKRLAQIAENSGGQAVDKQPHLFQYPSIYKETTGKIVQSLFKMNELIQQEAGNHYGVSLIITETETINHDFLNHLQHLQYQTLQDNAIWVDKKALKSLDQYFIAEKKEDEDLIRVLEQKEAVRFLGDKRTLFETREDEIRNIGMYLEQRISRKTSKSVLVLKGTERYQILENLSAACENHSEGLAADILVCPPAIADWDTYEPFIQSLDKDLLQFMKNADFPSTYKKYQNSAFDFFSQLLSEKRLNICRDRVMEEFPSCFIFYLECFIRRQKERDRPALFVCLGSEMLQAKSWSLLKDVNHSLKHYNHFSLVLIHDIADDNIDITDDVINEIGFPPMGNAQLEKQMTQAGLSKEELERMDLAKVTDILGGSPGELFYYCLDTFELMLAGRNAARPAMNVLKSFDQNSLCIFICINLAEGLFTRRYLASFLRNWDSQFISPDERLNRLIQWGFLFEDCRGVLWSRHPELLSDSLAWVSFEQKKLTAALSAYLFGNWVEKREGDLFRLFLFLKDHGDIDQTLDMMIKMLEYHLNLLDLETADKLLKSKILTKSIYPSSIMEAYQNIFRFGKLRLLLLQADPDIIEQSLNDGADLLIPTSGSYAEYFRLQQSRYYYTHGDGEKNLNYAKTSLFEFQKNGDHHGESMANIELGLSFLANRKVRTAMEYFEIGKRISYQINDTYNYIRSCTLEALSLFNYGNLSRSAQNAENTLKIAQKDGRYDAQLILIFLLCRILFEEGCYNESAEKLQEGAELAQRVHYQEIQKIFLQWQARSLAYAGKTNESRRVLAAQSPNRENLFFLSEASFLDDDFKSALEYAERAENWPLSRKALIGEKDLWLDGFCPIEGRLYWQAEKQAVLLDQIKAFRFFLTAKKGQHETGRQGLHDLCYHENDTTSRPYQYHYTYLLSLIILDSPNKNMEEFLHQLNMSINQLQARASRFHDQKRKRSFLEKNYWHQRLVEEARKRKFL